MTKELWQFVELVATGNTEMNVLEGMADDLLEAKCNQPATELEEIIRQRDEYRDAAYRLENTIRLLRMERTLFMTVSELIEALEKMPPRSDIWMHTDAGGRIAEVQLETYKKFDKDVTQVILADKKHMNWKPEAQCSDPGCYVCRKPEPME